jgi:hypothetical protein
MRQLGVAALVGSDNRMQGEGACLRDGIEVPSIGSRDVDGAEALGYGDDGGVNGAERQVRLLTKSASATGPSLVPNR